VHFYRNKEMKDIATEYR